MTTIEKTAIALFWLVGAIFISLAMPNDRDIAASTRAMLKGGFEGRTEVFTVTPIVATADLLRRTML